MPEAASTPLPTPSLTSLTKLFIPFALLLGLALRLYEASTTYLNPDECMHLYRAWSKDWANQTAIYHHPPVLFFLLHHLQALNHSEIFLRLPQILCGTLFPWVTYKWFQHLQFPFAAWAAFLLLEFSPNLIPLSAQLRGYTIALFFTAAALYFLEIALQRRSLLHLSLFAASLYIAILTEFSVAFATAGLGIYALLRLVFQTRNWAFWGAWAATQIGALGLYAYLYSASVSNLLADSGTKELISGYLALCFPQPGQNRLLFSMQAIFRQFSYLGASAPIGLILLALFLLGLLALCRASLSSSNKLQQRSLAVAILGALAIALTASLLLLHPLGRSRHTIILALFTTISIALAVQWICEQFPRVRVASLTLGIVTILLSFVLAAADTNNVPRSRNGLAAMRQAVQQIEELVPKGSTVLLDHETGWVLSYYLERNPNLLSQSTKSGSPNYPFTAYRGYAFRWDYRSGEEIAEDQAKLRRRQNLPTNQPIYFLDTGFTQLSSDARNAEDLYGVFLLLKPESAAAPVP